MIDHRSLLALLTETGNTLACHRLFAMSQSEDAKSPAGLEAQVCRVHRLVVSDLSLCLQLANAIAVAPPPAYAAARPMIVEPQPPATTQFQTSLLGCAASPRTTAAACLCPCVTYGANRDRILHQAIHGARAWRPAVLHRLTLTRTAQLTPRKASPAHPHAPSTLSCSPCLTLAPSPPPRFASSSAFNSGPCTALPVTL